MKAPLPPNEEERLRALAAFNVLDTPREPAYDDLVTLASAIFNAPIAAITFIDRDRQWIKASVGLEITETPREIAFCAHAILQPERLLVVKDASKDARFCDNPVTGAPLNVRFYASSPLLTSDGHALGALCVCAPDVREITPDQERALQVLARQVVDQLEMRRTLQYMQEQAVALERAREAADAALRDKTMFLANLSHEIRTPMNGIIGVAGLLGTTQLTERQRNYVEMIARSGESLMGVLQDALDFAAVNEQALRPNRKHAHVPTLLSETLAMFLPAAVAQRVQLVPRTDSTLEHALNIDAVRLRQVLNRLIGSAIRATSRGAVSLNASRVGNQLCIEVSNVAIAGTSSPPLALEGILELVRPVTEPMDGSVEMMYRERGPVGIVVRIPIPGDDSVSEPTVLIAEDNEVNSLVLAAMLEDRGCRVTCVETGLEAVEAMRSRRFDLVFMDIQMPDMDGITATQEVRRAEGNRRTPIVAVTASALGGDEAKYREAGIDELIQKPISERTIVEALRRWVATY